MAESSSESVWNCLKFSWITWYHSFLNYYWNSDEFSRYSEKFRFAFQKTLVWMCLNSGWIVFWICLNFSWITFLNYYWNSDEFSQYSEKFRFAFQKTLVHIHFWIITEIRTNSANIQKNSDLHFRKLWYIYISELLLKFGWIQPIFRKIQICVSEKFRPKIYAYLNLGWIIFSQYSEKFRFAFQNNSDRKCLLLIRNIQAPLTMHRPDIPIIFKSARIHFKE